MKFLPALIALTATACAGVEKPAVTSASEEKPAMSEAEVFEHVTKTLGNDPALAGYMVKAQLGKRVWSKDRQKEAATEVQANYKALGEIIGEVTDLSAAKHTVTLQFSRLHPNESGTLSNWDMDVNIHP
jgi:hypothetical protein